MWCINNEWWYCATDTQVNGSKVAVTGGARCEGERVTECVVRITGGRVCYMIYNHNFFRLQFFR